MRTINGTNYISFKEYAEIKGVSQARISQTRHLLPVEKLEDLGVELINYDLLELPEKEKALAQLRFSTHIPVHTFTYQQLGVYFADLIQQSVAGRQNAEALLSEKTVQLEEWQAKATELQEIVNQLRDELHKLSDEYNEVAELAENLETVRKSLENTVTKLSQQVESLQAKLVEKEQQILHLQTQLNSQASIDEIVEKVVLKLNAK